MALCCFCIYAALAIFALIILKLLLEKIKIGKLGTRPIFISGCDTGFGHWLALKLLGHGAPVFAGCLTEKGEDELKKRASYLPGRLETVPLDVTSQESVDKALAFVKEKLGDKGLWGLVNNAGILGKIGADDFLDVDAYQKALDVNTLGVIRCTQAFKPLVKKTRGRIVTVTSIYGRVPGPTLGPYVVSKFAAEAYCDAIRHELAPYKVGVYILEPGLFKTDITSPEKVAKSFEKIWEEAPPEVRKDYGESYLEKYKNFLRLWLDQACSWRTDFVVDAYYHALTSRFPRKRYWVGYDSMFFFIPLSMLPTCLQDWVGKGAEKLVGMPKPEIGQTR